MNPITEMNFVQEQYQQQWHFLQAIHEDLRKFAKLSPHPHKVFYY
jgi:hypothetical protein